MLNHQLTPEQFQELTEALLNALPTRDKLKRMVHFGLNINLDKISNSHHLATDIFNLIQWAETTGKIPQLLTAANQHYQKQLGEKSAHPQLKRFGQQWWLKPIESDHPDLQRISSSPTQKRLLSKCGIDYSHLRDLLAAHNWTEADRETTRKMLEVMGQSENSYFKIEYLDNFPWEDLRIIDCLWLDYSNGHFGFSIQSRIYQELGGENRYNHRIWSAFGDRIGWREGNKWKDDNELMEKAENWSGERWEKSMRNHHIITGMMPVGKRGILRIPGQWEWEDKYLPDMSLICFLSERLAVFL